MLVQPCLHRDDDFEANAAKISAGVVRILHTLLEGYVPDADAHPGAHVNRDSSANPAAGQAAAGGCAATPAAAAGALHDVPALAGGERQDSDQHHHHQPQVRLHHSWTDRTALHAHRVKCVCCDPTHMYTFHMC